MGHDSEVRGVGGSLVLVSVGYTDTVQQVKWAGLAE